MYGLISYVEVDSIELLMGGGLVERGRYFVRLSVGEVRGWTTLLLEAKRGGLLGGDGGPRRGAVGGEVGVYASSASAHVFLNIIMGRKYIH